MKLGLAALTKLWAISALGTLITAGQAFAQIGDFEVKPWQREVIECQGWRQKNPVVTIHHCSMAIKHARMSKKKMKSVFAIRGVAYFNEEKYELALADFNHIDEMDPGNYSSYRWRGRIYFEMGAFEKAVGEFSNAIGKKPKYASNYNFRCWALTQIGQAILGLKDCKKSLKLRPNNADTLDSRGLAYHSLGRHKEAIKDYNHAIKRDPKAWSTYLKRARTYVKLGDNAKADEDQKVARKGAQDQSQYDEWVRAIEEAEKNNAHLYQKLGSGKSLLNTLTSGIITD